MELHELDNILKTVESESKSVRPKTLIKGISCNSQDIQEGFLFIAIKGYQQDGHRFISKAIENGACGVIGEKKITDLSVPYFQVDNSRNALSTISNHFYNFPTNGKIVIGVTGTNGKTSTSYLLRQILEGNGFSCALFGSTKNIINGKNYPTVNTTPNLLEINRLLAGSKDDVVIIEVSSHALTQHRVEGIYFDYALFTNLSQDHLDYHGSMEEYFQAKRKLFEMLKDEGKAIINTDDLWGEQLARQLEDKNIPTLAIGENEKSDVKLASYTTNPPSLLLKENNENISIRPSLYGLHNMYNIAMAYGTAKQIGVDTKGAISAIQHFQGIEGRFALTELSNGATLVVDYAHTPHALLNCLNTVRENSEGKLIHIFGFRGDRDPGKRKDMVSISSEMSDRYILTFDDLNSVSPEEMNNTLISYQERYGNDKGIVITDRTLAIEKAVKMAEMGDWIVITGKGHEKYQQHYHYPVNNDEEAAIYLTKAKD
ncbi:UDP-N-acetylmuramoyl-L-alanyl-D-glutamate--2,6-diaminopimelate ligase [Pontibacillus sp. ALD_SL1]|uniref:UDP-N-acetylmuramoyl-L-alanyl-D-glutamate--2, 6-diaminopimelate ligase n=1 Tax=Pontibacillus sp. ALD_SL1 TaxID=2777185 RepID=UPI001A965E44|nr:UDP-N-acetylmuramoyl-L-alanyl-D-glutamate--2,6-diaminopimelate ligase [Pontibacillus sp. ALD_SL1]QSS98777.1 UDP-N-acetylmuramoyl-L-alanyl-D-glutamate--2,6-diaminopimelate ligase [Pontibacillus sp. ALD_SL1]